MKINLPFRFYLHFNENSKGNAIWLMAYYNTNQEIAKDESLDNIEEFKNAISNEISKKVLYTFNEEEFNSLKKNKNEFTKFVYSLPSFIALMKKLGIKSLLKSEAIYLIEHIKVEKVNYSNDDLDKITSSIKDEDLKQYEDIIPDELQNKSKEELQKLIDEVDIDEFYEETVSDEYFENDNIPYYNGNDCNNSNN